MRSGSFGGHRAEGTLRDMHPIEQLRYVARAGGVDALALALEAADALGALASEPRALVPACRRLLEFHPTAGPLWWLCGEVLASSDPARAAQRAAEQLVEDATGAELAGELPPGALVAGACSPAIVEALAARPDVHARLVGGPLELRPALREIAHGAGGGAEVVAWAPEEAARALAGASVAVVEAEAAGPEGAVLSSPATTLVAEARRSGVELWLVCGVGRVLPGPLFAALAAGVEPAGIVPADAWRTVIGPDGAADARTALRAADQTVPSELLYRPRG